ncbi:hypothetical protein PAEVO_28770 [Paenibacillus sp. GM2FR]|nr:hypothetical protein PAEVO_28770 [Paenibacillus sp. GM2FR]
MKREDLVEQARLAAKSASHNLEVISRNPDKMQPGKLYNGVVYLNNMIRLAEKELETKKDRRPGQSRLRSRLMSLLVSIVADEQRKRKERTT